ncbi:MAG: InlB B-repeat-containing protein [Kiritimatiellae bacterium]|nr:InlB B-repeat-containing protein [Kiritimatiellia bacterium]
MKKMIAAIVMAVGCGLAAFGGDGGSDMWTDAQGVEWSFDWSGSNASGYTATITYCDDPSLFGIAIPATVYADGGSRACKVTRLAGWSFSWCPVLESVVIPSSVTTIDAYAFGSCTALNSVTFKGSVPSGCNFNTAFYGTAFLNDCKTSNWFDSFASPYPIAGASGSVLSDNYLATTQSGEPLSQVCNTKWLRWTAPKSGTVWFHTQGSKFDTKLGVYQGATLSSLTKVEENDDFMLDRTSQVSFEAVGGETYYVCVGGYLYSKSRGEFKLAWRMGTPITLTLDPNGGNFYGSDVPSIVTVPKNAGVGGLPTPSKTDYTMSAWYTKKTGGTKVTASTKFAKNTTLFARWAKSKFKVILAAGNAGAKKVAGSGTYAWGSKVKLKATPKSGYSFWYWAPDDTDSENAFPSYLKNMRKDSVTLTVPKNAVRYRAFFVKKSDDAISMSVLGPTEIFAEDGVGEKASVYVSTLSYPTVKASGVPAGVKFKAQAGSDNVYTLSVTDDLKIPPGRHAVKVTAKNRSGKSVSKTFVVWGRNNAAAADAGYITLPNRSAKTPDEMDVGIAPDWSIYGIAAQNGYKISKVDGLPSGLAWDAKHQTLTGIPTKSGRFSLAITIKKGSKKYTVTTTFYVNALPSSVVGTFRGYTAVDSTTFGAGSRMVTVTVSKDGKISATSGDYKMSGLGFRYSPGTPVSYYIAELDGSYKDKKKTEYVRKLHFQIFDPSGYFANDAVGDLTHGTKKKGGAADTSIDTLCLRKNIFGRKADGTALVDEKAQSALEYVACYQDNRTITLSSGHSVSLKFNRDANGRLNGFVTLSGDLGSGSAMLFYEDRDYTFRKLVARFKIGARAVEVHYKMYFSGPGESATIQSSYLPEGTVWTE